MELEKHMVDLTEEIANEVVNISAGGRIPMHSHFDSMDKVLMAFEIVLPGSTFLRRWLRNNVVEESHQARGQGQGAKTRIVACRRIVDQGIL